MTAQGRAHRPGRDQGLSAVRRSDQRRSRHNGAELALSPPLVRPRARGQEVVQLSGFGGTTIGSRPAMRTPCPAKPRYLAGLFVISLMVRTRAR
ncbi:hypothetical protein SAMN05443637_13015 [Pseudonocardia thermophila]|uniref:Uncharacterized protein n=1 Tax=Pseudonocardia thermophila TaxID=1848 RepID=A0A1M7AUR6_PSETH|nr:hypothetical protein SAMN05443637_13015 [Pseudonocardia thermophila]